MTALKPSVGGKRGVNGADNQKRPCAGNNMAEKHPLDQTHFDEFGQSLGVQKRIKLEDQVENSPNVPGGGDPHNAPPSRVVHARAVPDGCTHTQMVAALSKYGTIS